MAPRPRNITVTLTGDDYTWVKARADHFGMTVDEYVTDRYAKSIATARQREGRQLAMASHDPKAGVTPIPKERDKKK